MARALSWSRPSSPERGGPPLARTVQIVLAFGAIYFIWGSTYLAIRVALESFPPFLLMGLRSMLAGAILYLWALRGGAARPVRRQWRSATLCGALLFLIGHGGLAWGEQRVASGIASLLLTTEAFWIALLGWRLAGEDRPGIRVLGGLVAGFLGVGLLIGPRGDQGEAALDPWGTTVLLLAAVAWAVGSLHSRSTDLPASSMLSAGMQLLAGGFLLGLAALATGEAGLMAQAIITVRALAALAYLIVFGSVLTFSAYIWLLKVVSPARVATHSFVNPAVALLLGWGLLDEPLTPTTMLATAIIVSAVALVVTQARSAEHPAKQNQRTTRRVACTT